MKERTKPSDWNLGDVSTEALFNIALKKLRQRTIREGDKMDESFEAGIRDEKQRSKFYAIWYAFEALNIFAMRVGYTPAIEPFKEKSFTKLKDQFDVKNVIVTLKDGNVLHLTPEQVELVKEIEIGKR